MYLEFELMRLMRTTKKTKLNKLKNMNRRARFHLLAVKHFLLYFVIFVSLESRNK